MKEKNKKYYVIGETDIAPMAHLKMYYDVKEHLTYFTYSDIEHYGIKKIVRVCDLKDFLENVDKLNNNVLLRIKAELIRKAHARLQTEKTDKQYGELLGYVHNTYKSEDAINLLDELYNDFTENELCIEILHDIDQLEETAYGELEHFRLEKVKRERSILERAKVGRKLEKMDLFTAREVQTPSPTITAYFWHSESWGEDFLHYFKYNNQLYKLVTIDSVNVILDKVDTIDTSRYTAREIKMEDFNDEPLIGFYDYNYDVDEFDGSHLVRLARVYIEEGILFIRLEI